MSKLRSRLVPILTAIGIAAMVSGCVVYPVGGGGGYYHHYYHWR